MIEAPAPSESIIYSQATPDDLPMVQALLRENGLPSEDAGEHLEHFILAKEGDVLVATAGVELLGSAGLLRSVCVARNCRNRGVAGELCRRMEASAFSAGVRHLYLLTTSAEEYFKRRGYRVCSRESLPAGVKGTAEFRSLCPASALSMVRDLDGDEQSTILTYQS
ncbi:arsenic resistance N-acetyltransferase ArsN2 [Chlorobium ferrooxidans]|uniref:GCN5-related N-acetyltransferase n=1 Tax=Chlorobium ferrooxidans DSM 13031 TaxID=377431 RepID=Q0YPN4_9CHLB|nr:arsenic resistance N-acetyltransferase ArsN2 [Chlorobium ferrooxidans]EAT58257.1 GCN5-related N-acetyltransferase [Chlorobium ferrooxidans DSM 13031]